MARARGAGERPEVVARHPRPPPPRPGLTSGECVGVETVEGKVAGYDYLLPEHLGGRTITVRLHGTDDDVRRKFNRTENVRPIPAGDPDFGRLYRRRNDAESINRALDDTLFLRRAHSVGHERQQLNLLTFALTVNSLAVHRHTAIDERPARHARRLTPLERLRSSCQRAPRRHPGSRQPRPASKARRREAAT